MKNHNIKHRLWSTLSVLKGFEVGYSSESDNKVIIEVDGVIYKVKLEETSHTDLKMALDEHLGDE